MTWLEIALIASNVVTVLVAAWRISGVAADRDSLIKSEAAIVYHSDNAHRFSQAMRTNGFALRYYANPQAWQSPERGKHSDAFRDRGERAREALEAAKKILEEGK